MPKERPVGSSEPQFPPLGAGKEVLTTCLEGGRGMVTLESDNHGLQVAVPNLEDPVEASIFVDDSAGSVVVGYKMHVILPIVTCGPDGLQFEKPLSLRFPVGDKKESTRSSDDEYNHLKCTYKVVMQKGNDTSSSAWTVLDSDLVPDGDNFFLEAKISHFCRFGLAQELERYEENSGYIEADLSWKSSKKGIVRFVNLSDKTATFYLQPEVFDTRQATSGSLSVVDPLSASLSRKRKRTMSSTKTALFVDTVVIGKDRTGDGRLGESVRPQITVAITTSQLMAGDGSNVGRGSTNSRQVRVWDAKTVKHKKALILLNSRFVPLGNKCPLFGHFVVHEADEEGSNIARKVHHAITK
ncbi:unnamed protein product [Ascophyllum nodosum]